MSSFHVQVLKLGEAEVPRPEVFWMSGWGEWELLFFYMVVIRGNGVTAVINTGPPADLRALNQRWVEFAGPRCQLRRDESERPQNALRRIGVAPEDVTHVLVTPLQLYATANIPLFPNAKIYVSRRGWIEEILAPLPWLHVPRQFCLSDDLLKFLLFDMSDRLVLMEERDEIVPGLRSRWVGTHHRSSVLFLVNTESGTVGVSDCAFKYGNVEGHALGIGESLAEGYEAYKYIRSSVQHFVPLYDPDVLIRYPDGVVR